MYLSYIIINLALLVTTSLTTVSATSTTTNNTNAIQQLDVSSCAANSTGSVCSPQNDSPSQPIGDHINLVFIATGVRRSTGISSALRSRKSGKITYLSWNQRNASGYSNGSAYYHILTSHNAGIQYGDVGKAFAGEGQLPCSLFDDNPGGQGTFDWLLTHYFGRACAYDKPWLCHAAPLLTNVPPFQRPRSILLKDNAEVCGR